VCVCQTVSSYIYRDNARVLFAVRSILASTRSFLFGWTLFTWWLI